MDEVDIVPVLLRRASAGDRDCALAAEEITRLRGIAGRAARCGKRTRDLKQGRRALNPKLRVCTRGLPVHERIKARTVVDESTGCWVWQGSCCNGYARLRRGDNGKGAFCHRVMFEHHNGPIPERHVVMHTCDNRRCVNPAHLKSGTQKENIHDMHRKGRSGRATLTPADVLEIRSMRKAGLGTDKIAAEYGIGTFTVQQIISGGTWAWVK